MKPGIYVNSNDPDHLLWINHDGWVFNGHYYVKQIKNTFFVDKKKTYRLHYGHNGYKPDNEPIDIKFLMDKPCDGDYNTVLDAARRLLNNEKDTDHRRR